MANKSKTNGRGARPSAAAPQRTPRPLVRDALPIPDRPSAATTTYDAKDPETQYPPIESLRPPKGAPNVLIVLIDDVGFGASSAFGGPCQTPNLERLAANGLKYTRFHTTALCSPTRQAMLEVPVWQTSPAGPFTQWPTQSGFEYFYGFIGGETNQWYPALYEGTTPIEPPKTPEQGYHLTADLADRAIKWARQQKSLMPHKPFFLYFAPGATHAPHQAPEDWIARYKGKFDQGWDKLREETFARQKRLGVVPANAQLTARHDSIPAWDTIPSEMKPVYAREMELYAAFLAHTDHHIGRLLDALKDLQVLDDTLVYAIVGDNGASAEGSLQGTFNEMVTLSGYAHLETPEYLRSRLDEFGKGGTLTLYLDGNEIGTGRIEQTEPFLFSADETLDIGMETGSPVTRDYDVRAFNGEVKWVELDVAEDAADAEHVVSAQERMNLALGLQ